MSEQLRDEIKRLRERCEQLEVQLAGCGVVALGYGDACKPGDYGYSASLEDVKKLRSKLKTQLEVNDAQCAAYREALLEIENFCGLSINLNAPISAIKLKEIATKALSSDAGTEMLERMKKLEGFLSSIAYCEKPNLEVEMNTLEAENYIMAWSMAWEDAQKVLAELGGGK